MPTQHPQRPAIEARLKSGEFASFSKLAGEFGVSPQTVSRYAADIGVVPLDRNRTKNAENARRTYDAERRKSVIDAAIDMVSEMIAAQQIEDRNINPQQLAIALATLIDKRRQEDDLPTGTVNVRHGGHVTHGHIDLSKFSDEQLADLERLAESYEGASS